METGKVAIYQQIWELLDTYLSISSHTQLLHNSNRDDESQIYLLLIAEVHSAYLLFVIFAN